MQTVASRSGTVTGRSAISMPSALVLPMTWPPLMPPPARTVVHEVGQWSRPCCRLIFGVRPNSPIQTISVESSRPRCFRSSISVAQAGSSTSLRRRTAAKFWPCVSQPKACWLLTPRQRHLDERHPLLDQPPCQQTALAEQVAAIGVAQLASLSSSRLNALAAAVSSAGRRGRTRSDG